MKQCTNLKRSIPTVVENTPYDKDEVRSKQSSQSFRSNHNSRVSNFVADKDFDSQSVRSNNKSMMSQSGF